MVAGLKAFQTIVSQMLVAINNEILKKTRPQGEIQEKLAEPSTDNDVI